MSILFEHEDGTTSHMTYLTVQDEQNFLLFDGQAPGNYGDDATRVRVDRDAVLRLHAALGEWLYPVHTSEWANKSLIEQMIQKAVKDQVAAVLPLHLTPFAAQMQAAEDKIERVANALMDDPEPHDVGHAEEPEPDPLFAPGARAYYREALGLEPERTGPCDARVPFGALLVDMHDCGYIWAAHRPSAGVKGPETNHGRLMSELPVRTRPRPICVSCGHGWGQHYSGICWGEPGTAMQSEPGCTCTRERPGTAGTP